MKFDDIPAPKMTLRVKIFGSSRDGLWERLARSPISVSSVAANHREGVFDICLSNDFISVQPVSKADANRLNLALLQSGSMLAQITSPAQDQSFELQVAFFPGPPLEMGEVEIGIDEYVDQCLNKMGFLRERENKRTKEKIERQCSLLQNLCVYKDGKQDYFFLTAGPAIRRYIRPEKQAEEENEQEEQPEFWEEDIYDDVQSAETEEAAEAEEKKVKVKPPVEPDDKTSFCVTGEKIRFVASEKVLKQEEKIYLISRLTSNQRQTDSAIRLARGTLKFVDWSNVGKLQRLSQTQLEELLKSRSSYLKKWDEFGELEGDILLTKARTIGVISREEVFQEQGRNNTIKLHFSSPEPLQKILDCNAEALECTNVLPEYLTDPKMTFAKYVESLMEAESLSSKDSAFTQGTIYPVVESDPRSRTLTLEGESLPQSGQLIYAMTGEIKQIERRILARRRILEGRSANPQLGILIEENGRIQPTRSPHKVKPLTAFVRNKIFRKAPTPKQEQAVQIALNTPDIALIQGPPGTGKTTVIAAILERLNEDSEKRGSRNKGRVLLTGFQHDAVENMIDRIEINSLPTPKFGRRSGSDSENFTRFEYAMEKWCAGLAEAIRQKNPQVAEYEEEQRIRDLCVQYLRVPTRKLALALVSKIEALGILVLGNELYQKVILVRERLSKEETLNELENSMLPTLRSLRTTSEGFADDGPDRAEDVLEALRDILEKEQIQLLEKARDWRGSGNETPPFLKELHELKKQLFYAFTTPPVFRVEKLNQEVMRLTEKAIDKIRSNRQTSEDQKNIALAEFLSELDYNPGGMIDAVSDYSFAFAATCQQSINKQMLYQKGLKKNEEDSVVYDYVIVDEAARVSPRDLMIAMAQGKRIILVGDHRQLPHLIDEEVARQMETAEPGLSESEWLKKSMFEYLFSERLKSLETQDPEHPRRVTLDRQYRMHPVLGDFISRNFYESFNPEERFESGRDAEDFVHNLPETNNKPAAWLEVPAVLGGHERRGTSWIRQAEANAIAEKLKLWRNSEEGKNLSYGVISFYKAQADLIRQQYGKLANDDQIRIGTVDSFQGMEFDVVFLSMVRTMPANMKFRSEDSAIRARQLYGHLCLYNRLNVAMSRQKKLLVLVGDSSILNGSLATEFVPGLVNFHKLCREKGVVLECR